MSSLEVCILTFFKNQFAVSFDSGENVDLLILGRWINLGRSGYRGSWVQATSQTLGWTLWLWWREKREIVSNSYYFKYFHQISNSLFPVRCSVLPSPSPSLQNQPSPASCRQRCDTNITQVSFGFCLIFAAKDCYNNQGQRNAWTEGICGCTPTCFLEFGWTHSFHLNPINSNFSEDCCHDYTSLCGIHNIEPRMDSAPWSAMGFVLGGLLIVMAVTTALILLLGRRRRVLDRAEEESMLSEEESRGGEGRVVMVEGDCGETIDFRLSTTESQPRSLGPCQMYTTIWSPGQ